VLRLAAAYEQVIDDWLAVKPSMDGLLSSAATAARPGASR
jgi:hypothetical protein